MDFVALLREYVMQGKAIKYDTETNQVVFDDQRFPKDVETNFKGQNGKHYKLEDVWFLLQHREKPWLQYVKECNAFKFAIVSFLDHKDLLSYLTGKTDSSAKITAPVDYDPSSASGGAGSAGAATGLAPLLGAGAPASQSDSLSVQPMDIDQGGNDASSSRAAGGHQVYEPHMDVTAGGAALDDGDENDRETKRLKEPERPLTQAELRIKMRKERTIEMDREQMMKIGEDREMKLAEILADAEEVDKIRAQERSVVTHSMLLRSTTRNFKHILNLLYLRQTDGKNRMRGASAAAVASSSSRGSSSAQKRGRSSSSSNAAVKGDKRKRPDAGIVPIIIVPAAMTSLITIVNAKDFLENGQWIPTQKKKEEMRSSGAMANAGALSGQRISFDRIIVHEDGSESKTRFEVVDNTRNFKKDDWSRVIAVFTNGKEWEFKGWKLGDPKNMFHTVSGFYLNFRNDAVPASIGAWKVSVLSLEKHARHNDITAQRQFWETLKAESSNRPLFHGIL